MFFNIIFGGNGYRKFSVLGGLILKVW